MISKVKRHATRTGCQATKFVFSIAVENVVLPIETNIVEGASMSVCFERGGKISASTNVLFDKELHYAHSVSGNSYFSVNFDEKVELISTLYKDPKTNRYQEKNSKIMLRQLKRNSLFNVVSYKGLGVYTLQLHTIAAEIGYNTTHKTSTLKLPLEMLAAGSYLEVVITTTVLKSQVVDDSRSVLSALSTSSDLSLIGATFDPVIDTASHSTNTTEHRSRSSNGSAIGNSFYYKSSEFSIPEQYQKRVGAGRDQSVEEEQEEDYGAELSLVLDHEDIEYHTAAEGRAVEQSSGKDSSPAEESLAVSSTHVMRDRAKTAPAAPATPDTSPGADDELDLVEKIRTWNLLNNHNRLDKNRQKKANKEAFRLYTEELDAKTKRIQALESAIHLQAAAHKAQILSLHTQLNTAQKLNRDHERREAAAREVITAAYDKADVKIAEQLNDARQETAEMVEEYSRVCAELQCMSEEVVYYKALADAALEEKRQEMQLAQNAATVAVQACLRRAEVEQENEYLVDELIDFKVRFADVSCELDAEVRRSHLARHRLQFYAEQFAAMEIRFSTSTAANSTNESTRDPDGEYSHTIGSGKNKSDKCSGGVATNDSPAASTKRQDSSVSSASSSPADRAVSVNESDKVAKINRHLLKNLI